MPSPADFSHSGIKPGSPALQADSLSTEPPRKPYFNRWFYFFLSPALIGSSIKAGNCSSHVCSSASK